MHRHGRFGTNFALTSHVRAVPRLYYTWLVYRAQVYIMQACCANFFFDRSLGSKADEALLKKRAVRRRMRWKLDALGSVVPRAKCVGQRVRCVRSFAEILASAGARGTRVLEWRRRIQLFRERVAEIAARIVVAVRTDAPTWGHHHAPRAILPHAATIGRQCVRRALCRRAWRRRWRRRMWGWRRWWRRWWSRRRGWARLCAHTHTNGLGRNATLVGPPGEANVSLLSPLYAPAVFDEPVLFAILLSKAYHKYRMVRIVVAASL